MAAMRMQATQCAQRCPTWQNDAESTLASDAKKKTECACATFAHTIEKKTGSGTKQNRMIRAQHPAWDHFLGHWGHRTHHRGPQCPVRSFPGHRGHAHTIAAHGDLGGQMPPLASHLTCALSGQRKPECTSCSPSGVEAPQGVLEGGPWCARGLEVLEERP